MFEDDHFIQSLGQAREYATSPEHVHLMREAGYVKGGTEDVMLIGKEDR